MVRVRWYGWIGMAAAAALVVIYLVQPGQRAGAEGNHAGKDNESLLAQLVCAEARAEPYEGKVAVAAVILNRVDDDRFPNSVAGVVYETHAFESVDNGEIYRGITAECEQAAMAALNGHDPVQGAVFFYAPAKTEHPFMTARPRVREIGGHVFAH